MSLFLYAAESNQHSVFHGSAWSKGEANFPSAEEEDGMINKLRV
ncbi:MULTISPECIES: hypothetical protein [Brevibacillus]|nr:hypothetical protein [Brevibacillus antibioticus]